MRVVGGLLRNKIKEEKTPIQIPIPIYMKTNMGFEPKTCAFFFIPHEVNDSKRELFLTQINPYDWGDLWKFNIILKERIGVVTDILDLIIEEKAWSCITETLTTEWNDKHEITVVFKPNRSRKVRGLSIKKLASLRRQLYKKLQEKLHDDFFIHGHPEITQMNFLFTLWERMKKLEKVRTEDHKINIENYMGRIDTKGWIEVPNVYQKVVSEYFNTTPKIFVFSDTEEKYVKYSFYTDSDSMYWIDIAYSRFRFLRLCLRFFSESKVNILGGYSLPIMIKESRVFGVYSVILQLRDYIKRNAGNILQNDSTEQIIENLDRDLKSFIHNSLSKKDSQIKNEIESGISLRAKIYNPYTQGLFDTYPGS